MIRAILFNLRIQEALIFITIFCLYFVYIPPTISSFTKKQSLFKNISYIVFWYIIYISFKNSNLLLNVISLALFLISLMGLFVITILYYIIILTALNNSLASLDTMLGIFNSPFSIFLNISSC